MMERARSVFKFLSFVALVLLAGVAGQAVLDAANGATVVQCIALTLSWIAMCYFWGTGVHRLFWGPR